MAVAAPMPRLERVTMSTLSMHSDYMFSTKHARGFEASEQPTLTPPQGGRRRLRAPQENLPRPHPSWGEDRGEGVWDAGRFRAPSSAPQRRATICFLISAMALAGFRLLGQVRVQFMMVWQR